MKCIAILAGSTAACVLAASVALATGHEGIPGPRPQRKEHDLLADDVDVEAVANGLPSGQTFDRQGQRYVVLRSPTNDIKILRRTSAEGRKYSSNSADDAPRGFRTSMSFANTTSRKRQRAQQRRRRRHLNSGNSQSWCKEDCESALGIEYRGCVDETWQGHECIDWDQYYKEDYPSAGLFKNRCRNPDHDANGPWCLFDGGWDYCDVPSCLAYIETTSPAPTPAPTAKPTKFPPTASPTKMMDSFTSPGTMKPTMSPTDSPTTRKPTRYPTPNPTSRPTRRPTMSPTGQPVRWPTSMPSSVPTRMPTNQPSFRPTRRPTATPTKSPNKPNHEPTRGPTSRPTQPTSKPTRQPTRMPTQSPTKGTPPTKNPTRSPSKEPTKSSSGSSGGGPPTSYGDGAYSGSHIELPIAPFTLTYTLHTPSDPTESEFKDASDLVLQYLRDYMTAEFELSPFIILNKVHLVNVENSNTLENATSDFELSLILDSGSNALRPTEYDANIMVATAFLAPHGIDLVERLQGEWAPSHPFSTTTAIDSVLDAPDMAPGPVLHSHPTFASIELPLYHPTTDKECFTSPRDLRSAIRLYVRTPASDTMLAQKFGWPINDWCVEYINDFSYAFATTDFNEAIDKWDLSRATDTRGMFYEAAKFDQDISSWNTSLVTDMGAMFFNADAFNADISGWDVFRVTDMSYMFARTQKFDVDISSWLVANVETMKATFANAKKFNQDISNWELGKVVDLEIAFYNADSFDQDLCGWSNKFIDGREVIVTDMFTGTKCAVQTPPVSSSGPYCVDCTAIDRRLGKQEELQAH